MSRENTLWVFSIWFAPMNFPQMIWDPQTRSEQIAFARRLIGLYSPMALIASAPTELDAKSPLTVAFTAPIAASRIWIGSRRKNVRVMRVPALSFFICPSFLPGP